MTDGRYILSFSMGLLDLSIVNAKEHLYLRNGTPDRVSDIDLGILISETPYGDDSEFWPTYGTDSVHANLMKVTPDQADVTIIKTYQGERTIFGDWEESHPFCDDKVYNLKVKKDGLDYIIRLQGPFTDLRAKIISPLQNAEGLVTEQAVKDPSADYPLQEEKVRKLLASKDPKDVITAYETGRLYWLVEHTMNTEARIFEWQDDEKRWRHFEQEQQGHGRWYKIHDEEATEEYARRMLSHMAEALGVTLPEKATSVGYEDVIQMAKSSGVKYVGRIACDESKCDGLKAQRVARYDRVFERPDKKMVILKKDDY